MMLAPTLTECLRPSASKAPSTSRLSALLCVEKSKMPAYIVGPSPVAGLTAPSVKAYLESLDSWVEVPVSFSDQSWLKRCASSANTVVCLPFQRFQSCESEVERFSPMSSPLV
ncbi:hypothetical protein D3C77_617100 [compost metagenome]